MKEVKLKINFQQLEDLLHWLNGVLIELGNSTTSESRCICSVLANIKFKKLVEKTFFRFSGEKKISLQAHEAYALMYALEWIPTDPYPYLNAWTNQAMIKIDQTYS